MLGLGADRTLRRGGQSGGLCEPRAHAARTRHHGGLRAAQERELEARRAGAQGRGGSRLTSQRRGDRGMLRAVGRIIALPIAFVLAAAVTLFVIFSLGQERAVQAVTGRGPEEIPIGAVMDLVGLAMRLASVYTLLPALLLVIVGEVARIRSSLYYVVGGGVALAVVPMLTRLGQPMTVLELSPVVWQVLATAGFAGGFVYWLLAGRNA